MSDAAKVGHLRVVKKLTPFTRGAIKLHEQFGDALICVRHRVDADAKVRYTTVELLVGRSPIKARPDKLVGVRIDLHERALQQTVRAAGGVWDARRKLWILPKRLAGILRLTDRVVGAQLYSCPHIATRGACGNM